VSSSNGWVEQDGRPTCQAMLQSVATKEQRYFNGLDRLVAFLQAQAQREGMARQEAWNKT